MTTEVNLELFQFQAERYIGPNLAKAFAIPAKVGVERFSDEIVCTIRQRILGEQLKRIEIRYPSDWWQALKARWYPDWAKRRWPVRHQCHIVDVKALYPKISIPDREPAINVDWDKWVEPADRAAALSPPEAA